MEMHNFGVHIDKILPFPHFHSLCTLIVSLTRGDIQGGLFAGDLGRHRLQPLHRRAVPEDVVPDLRLGDDPPHPRRRPRHRVRPKVHHK